jgi:putative DNA primase/helicase
MCIYRQDGGDASAPAPISAGGGVPPDLPLFLDAAFDPDDVVLVRLVETWTDPDGRKRSKLHSTHRYTAAALARPGVWEVLDRHARAYRCNVFFGVCPRYSADEGFDLACQVRVVRSLWGDIDDAKPDEVRERCRRAGVPDPSIGVSTGRGAQVYWLLDRPFLIDDAPEPDPIHASGDGRGHVRLCGDREEPADPQALISPKGHHVQGLVAGIAAAVGGDHTHDLARLLRLPGTLNRKEQRTGREPRPCVLAWCDPDRRHPIDAFAPWKADLARPQARHKAGATPIAACGTPYPPTRSWDEMTPAQLARFDQLHAASADAPVGSRSEADFALACHCVRAGLDPEEVFPRVEGAGKFAEAGWAYFARTWDRAAAVVAREDDGIRDLVALPSPFKRNAAPAAERPAAECEPAVVSARDPYRAATDFVGREWADPAGRQLLRFHRQAYWRYDGRRWREADIEQVRGRLWRWLRTGCVERSGDRMDAAFRPTKAVVDGVENALRGLCLLPADAARPPCWLDGRAGPDPGGLVAFANGLLDLGTMALLGHTPDWFSTTCLPRDHDPAAGCPEWLRFLDDVSGGDADWIDRLGEWFGYNLTTDNSQQMAAFFVGPRRSGKSTTANVLAEVVGRDNVAATSFADLGSSFGLEDLVGMSAAVLPDAHLGRDADAVRVLERLKSITGNDPVRINPKGRKAFTEVLYCRFTLATNVLPRLPDASAAMRPRLLAFPFDRTFAGREDRGLTRRLLGELPGITNWALAGLCRLRERGRLTGPAAGERVLGQFERLSSPVQGFLDDCCVVEADASVPADDLRVAWAGWCEDNGVYLGSEEQFGVNLRSVAPGAEKTRPWVTLPDGRKVRRYVYGGIGLTEEAAAAVKARRVRHGR